MLRCSQASQETESLSSVLWYYSWFPPSGWDVHRTSHHAGRHPNQSHSELYSESLLDDWGSHPLILAAFIGQRSQYPQHTDIWELYLLAQLFLQHNRWMQMLHHCQHRTDLSISCSILPSQQNKTPDIWPPPLGEESHPQSGENTSPFSGWGPWFQIWMCWRNLLLAIRTKLQHRNRTQNTPNRVPWGTWLNAFSKSCRLFGQTCTYQNSATSVQLVHWSMSRMKSTLLFLNPSRSSSPAPLCKPSVSGRLRTFIHIGLMSWFLFTHWHYNTFILPLKNRGNTVLRCISVCHSFQCKIV